MDQNYIFKFEIYLNRSLILLNNKRRDKCVYGQRVTQFFDSPTCWESAQCIKNYAPYVSQQATRQFGGKGGKKEKGPTTVLGNQAENYHAPKLHLTFIPWLNVIACFSKLLL